MEADERPMKLQKLSHDLGDEASLTQISEDGSKHSSEDSRIVNNGASKLVRYAAADHTDDPISGSQGRDEDGSEPDISHVPEVANVPLSKNQLKKLRKKEAWEAGRDARKAKRREKIVEKRERKRAARQESEAELGKSNANGHDFKAPRRNPVRLPVTFLLDCGFDGLMMEKERISLGSQLTRCYSDNHRAPFQAHLVVSSWGGLLKERFDTVLERHHEHWRGVKFVTEDFVEAAAMAKLAMSGRGGGKLAGAFSSNAPPSNGQSDQDQQKQREDASVKPLKQDGETSLNGVVSPANPEVAELEQSEATHSLSTSDAANLDETVNQAMFPNGEDLGASWKEGEVVYLTSDSPYTLDKLKPYSTYIIGGLVDKNRHKGICYKTACDKGIRTAKLPIGQYMEMQSRFVLATSHVYEIMVKWLECGDWGEAFLQVIPKRKGGKLKSTKSSEADVDDTASEDGSERDRSTECSAQSAVEETY